MPGGRASPVGWLVHAVVHAAACRAGFGHWYMLRRRISRSSVQGRFRGCILAAQVPLSTLPHSLPSHSTHTHTHSPTRLCRRPLWPLAAGTRLPGGQCPGVPPCGGGSPGRGVGRAGWRLLAANHLPGGEGRGGWRVAALGVDWLRWALGVCWLQTIHQAGSSQGGRGEQADLVCISSVAQKLPAQ